MLTEQIAQLNALIEEIEEFDNGFPELETWKARQLAQYIVERDQLILERSAHRKQAFLLCFFIIIAVSFSLAVLWG